MTNIPFSSMWVSGITLIKTRTIPCNSNHVSTLLIKNTQPNHNCNNIILLLRYIPPTKYHNNIGITLSTHLSDVSKPIPGVIGIMVIIVITVVVAFLRSPANDCKH